MSEADTGDRRTRSLGFFLAHSAAGIGHTLVSVFLLDHYDGALGRAAYLWLTLAIWLAAAAIGVLAWWGASRLMLASGAFRGPHPFAAACSGVASMLAVVLHEAAPPATMALLALAVLVPASLGAVWTALSSFGWARPDRT